MWGGVGPQVAVLQAVDHLAYGALHAVWRPHAVELRRFRQALLANERPGLGAHAAERLLQDGQGRTARGAEEDALSLAAYAGEREEDVQG